MNPGVDRIAGRLKQLSQRNGTIATVQVKLIGLDEIREAAGERWPRMRERVQAGSLAILSKFVGADDVLIPAGDGFLIVSAEARGAEKIQDRCMEMREALLSFFLGEEHLARLRPELLNRALSAAGFADLLAGNAAALDASKVLATPVYGTAQIAQARLFCVRERRVGPSLCAPVATDRGVRRLAYNRDFILDGRHSEASFLETDIEVLGEARHLAQSTDAQHGLGFSVHAATIQKRRAREAYLPYLTEIRADLGRNAFVVVSEIEKGTPLLAIAEWIVAMRSRNLSVWLDFHYSDHAIANIGSTGASALSFQLPIFRGAQHSQRAELMLDHVKFWSRSARAQGLFLSIGGFYQGDFLSRAVLTGFDFAGGDELWPFKASTQSEPYKLARQSCERAARSG